MNTFLFDVTGSKRDRWTWKRIDETGKVLEASSGTFPYYLDCVEDASVTAARGTRRSRAALVVPLRDQDETL